MTDRNLGVTGNELPEIIVNIHLFEAMKQWFDFHFPTAIITYTLSSVMENLCKTGLPIEYIEEQFYYNSMANQAGKLSILQLKALLDPHKRHLKEWNSY